MMGGKPGGERAEVEGEEGGVDGHVEDAGGEREPGFEVAPEGAEGALDPDIETALIG